MKKLKIKYNEYSFKTKTEAKWAVYFETLGIKFQYEDYGFDLGNMNYLPDMYLPELGMWVEIKGRDLNDYEEEKAKRLCIETKQPVLLLEGDPALKAYAMLTPAPHLNGGVDPINVNVFKADTDSGLLES